MSATQGYIVGHPAVSPPEPPVASMPLPEAAEQAVHVRPVGPNGLYPAPEGARPLSLPAWALRDSAASWLAEYLQSLRTLARAIPRFASLTIT